MKLLLDTHVLLWWLGDDPKLAVDARNEIADADSVVLVSVVSLWEIAIKIRIGKLRVDLASVEREVDALDFQRLAIEPPHLQALADLPRLHNDPFDQLLVAQAIVETALLVTADAAIAPYPVRVMPASG